jgi:thiol-disulfide isomerase/thioredoxin
MIPKINEFLQRHFGRILVFGGVGAYAVVAGPTCALITNSIGLPSPVSSAQAAEASPSITAPAWELKDVNGKTVKSSDFAGKVVVLDFWATWCPPCKAEIPGFVELQKQYGDKGLVVVGVSLDEQGPEVVTPFMKQFSMNYPVVMGDAKIVQAFGGIRGIPTTFVIDRSGKIVSRRVGFAPKETFEKEILPLL